MINLALLFIGIMAGHVIPYEKQEYPNIVLVLADDFGVGDIQAHYPENKIATPHLDRLVFQGMSFTDAHSGSAVCSPTRYGLLTGRYAWRTPLQEWVLGCYEPPLIDADRLTLPAYLQSLGYHTACIGKWHLGWDWPGQATDRRREGYNKLKNEVWDFTEPIAQGPTTRGFDYYFGTSVPNFPPFTYIENDRVTPLPTSTYTYDSTEGVVMPRNFEGHPMAPGWRFDRILPEITRRSVNYIHERSKLGQPFFLFFSMTSPHEPVVPSSGFRGKSGIAPIADFVMETDASVGQLMKAVKEAGIEDNTLFIFTADNGHSHYTGWEDLIAAGHYPSGPFRGHKGDIWEGGHRVPLIVRWPGNVEPGQQSDHLVCLTDVFATVAQITHTKQLPNHAGEDSFSFLPVLEGKKSARRKGLVSHSVKGEFAYRSGPWKLVFLAPGPLNKVRGSASQIELYHLGNDPAEQKNVANDFPKVVKRLSAELGALVNRGTSRPGSAQENDVEVQYDRVQLTRWSSETLTQKAH